MMNEYENIKKAYYSYNLSQDADLPEKILKYIQDRVNANRQEIEKIVEIYKSGIKVDSILNIISDEMDREPQSIGKTIIDKQGFMFSQVLMPVGIIGVKADDTYEIIKYFVRAIKSKNAIIVVSKKYSEYSLESLILIIIKEALNKYGLDDNLISMVDEKDYKIDWFDRLIYADEENRDNHKFIDLSKTTENASKQYVYVESDAFRLEAEKNKNVEILIGNINEIIDKIKSCKSAVIYTKDSQKAFTFINTVSADNIFVNANLSNAIETIDCEDEMFKYRNLIVPVPKDLIKKAEENENVVTEEITSESTPKEEQAMIEYKESLWQKIKIRFKNLFKF